MITNRPRPARDSAGVRGNSPTLAQQISHRRRGLALLFALVAIPLVLGVGPDSPSGSVGQKERLIGWDATTSRFDRTGRGTVQLSADDQIFNDAGSAPSISFSLVEGGLSAGSLDLGGNVDGSPLLAKPDGADGIPGTIDDGIELQLQSPAIDAGSDALLPADVFDMDGDGDTTEPFPTDFNGRDRVYDAGGGAGAVDMGATERGATLVAIESTKRAESVMLPAP